MTLSTEKVKQFISNLDTNAELKRQYQAAPEKVLKAEAAKDPRDDIWVYRIVVSALGLVVLSIVVGVLTNVADIQAADKVITLIASLGSAAIGALAGLLAPSPARQE